MHMTQNQGQKLSHKISIHNKSFQMFMKVPGNNTNKQE